MLQVAICRNIYEQLYAQPLKMNKTRMIDILGFGNNESWTKIHEMQSMMTEKNDNPGQEHC